MVVISGAGSDHHSDAHQKYAVTFTLSAPDITAISPFLLQCGAYSQYTPAYTHLKKLLYCLHAIFKTIAML